MARKRTSLVFLWTLLTPIVVAIRFLRSFEFLWILLMPIVRVIRVLSKPSKKIWLVKLLDMFNKNTPEHKYKSFGDYLPKTGDVIVSAYPKSGTYWTLQIALQIAYLGEAEFDYIHERVPWPDAPIKKVKGNLSDSKHIKESPTGLRIIKSHLEQPYVPYSPQARYIIVVRDPKEVFVSSYYFLRDSFFGIEFSPREWLDVYLSDGLVFGSWAEHVSTWWPYHDRDNVLLLSFIEMKSDIRAKAQQIAEFLNVKLSKSQMEKVLERSSFHYMKANEEKFNPSMVISGKSKKFATLIRSGKACNSSEILTPRQQAMIDGHFVGELKRLASDFPYWDFFGRSNSQE